MHLRMKQGGLLLLFLTLLLAMTGCGLFGGEKASDKIDPPVKDEKYVDEGESLDGNATSENTKEDATETEATQDTVKRVVYLIDKNGYVVPQTFNLPATNSVAKQSLEYMVEDGPITNMLPDGFQAVLPAGTDVSVDIQEGTAIVDFSKEFKEYKAEDEQKILEAITFTLTQFDTVNNVKLRINGKELKAMPANGTPIGDGVSRADGINLETSSVVDIQNSETVTLYFLADNGDQHYYYVPVTRRVKETENIAQATIDELIKGPSFASNLLTDMHNDVELIGNPLIKDGVVTLNFNKNLLGDMGGQAISDEVLNSIVLSITENKEFKQVSIQVDGKTDFVNAKGDEMTKPVSRPESVNTIGF